ncbi:TadE family protein [Acinetobacter baretiae]|uniref:TadE/TadG family type IV pilus assembly protein n=1 Tax=Acinetobacter baretiae TaxID=2605383 RepID=UPI002E2B50D7|nr:TadE family protein [Acinetobacter baretiae]
MSYFSYSKQIGVSITEFIIIAPLVLFLSLIGIQYGLIYNAKLNLTYAAYEASRAGAIYNADPARIQDAFFKGLIPYFSSSGIFLPGDTHLPSPFSSGPLEGNNPNLATIAINGKVLKETIQRSESAFIHIHMVNPSKASFDDWSDPILSQAYKIKNKVNARVIPNEDLDQKNDTIKPKSKQSIQDANVLKLRFVYGYEPRIPLMKNLFSAITAFFGSDRDAASIRILAAGRIPIVVDTSAQMLSPAIEGGLPINTVNRTGYLIGQDLIDRIISRRSMQWQVGYQDENLVDGIIDNLTSEEIEKLKKAATDFNGVANIGSDIAKGFIGNSSSTGHLSQNTHSIIGDTENIISCSTGSTITNFY